MIPSFTVTNSVSYQTSGAGMASNPIYWIRQRHTESGGTRTHKVSTKILGFGIFMIGVITLTIGLILGVQFPSYVKDKIRRDMCIFDKSHTFFDDWVQDTMYVRWNRVYHWTLVNPGAFLSGQMPRFAARGPYIYKEKRTLINVRFVGNKISYKTMYTQSFDEAATLRECGTGCSLHDQVTVINNAFIKKLFTVGGLDNFVSSHMPKFVTTTLNEGLNNDKVLRYMGCINAECRSMFNVTSTVNYTLLDIISIGKFIETNDTQDKQSVLESDKLISADGHIHLTHTRVLYNHIANATFANCDNFSNMSSTIFWEIKLASSDFTIQPFPEIEIHFNQSVEEVSFLRINLTERCSFSSITYAFISHMLQFSNWPMLLWSFSVCDDVESSCVIIEDTYGNVLSFFKVAKEFVNMHLLNFVAASVMASAGNSLVLTLSQHHVTIATEIGTDAITEGILPHHTSITDAFYRSPETVVTNCAYDRIDNNMIVREYNGSQFAPPNTYSGGNREYYGHSFVVPPSPECRTCTAPVTSGHEFEFFIPDVSRSLKFNSPTKMKRHDTDLFRYVISNEAFADSSGSCSSINLTSVSGYPLYTGTPCFRHTGCAFYEDTMEACSGTSFVSYFDIEPRTGRVWAYNIKLQSSTVISPVDIGNFVTAQHSDVTFVNQLVPMFWVEKSADVSQEDVEYFRDKVTRLMNASCGGVIGLTLVALVTMAISIFVGLLSTRKNRVLPINDEPQVSNHKL